MRINEILNEATGEYLVYHATHPTTMLKTLAKGFLMPSLAENDSEMGVTKPSISTSRSQYYRFPYGAALTQFVLNRDEIRKAGFSIKPFSYFKYFGTPEAKYVAPPTGHTMHKQETEERIVTKNDKPLPLVKPILVGIQYDSDKLKPYPDTLAKLKAYADKLGVPLQPFKSFKPFEFKAGKREFVAKDWGNKFTVTPLENGIVDIQEIQPDGSLGASWRGAYTPEQIEHIKQLYNGLLDPETAIWPK